MHNAMIAIQSDATAFAVVRVVVIIVAIMLARGGPCSK